MSLSDTTQRWPGVAEWAVALLTTGLAAAEFQTLSSRDRIQSSTSYYFQYPNIPAIHVACLVIDALIFLFPVLWIVTPAKKFCKKGLAIVAGLGFALCWYELIFATTVRSPVINLLSLPYAPVNNYGLLGSQVFGCYLIGIMPSALGNKIAMALVRVTMMICLWFVQLAIWGMVSRP